MFPGAFYLFGDIAAILLTYYYLIIFPRCISILFRKGAQDKSGSNAKTKPKNAFLSCRYKSPFILCSLCIDDAYL